MYSVECLANNIYFEARGESLAGYIAVAEVTKNRVASDDFPNSICEVVYQGKYNNGVPVKGRCQFSWYCDGKPEIIRDKKSWILAFTVALLHTKSNITGGALYYHSKGLMPWWAKYKQYTTTIDNHLFYMEA